MECVFSHGGLVVNKHHHNLSPESTHANVILNSWSKLDGIVPRRDLIKLFNEKSQCNCNKGNGSNVIIVDNVDPGNDHEDV